MKSIIYLFLLATSISCVPENKANIEIYKQEILATEKAFSDLSKKSGVPEAFLAFAAEDAVLNRSDSLIIGKENIRQRFEAYNGNQGTLAWDPEYVDVSSSGDLGYTYGYYTYSTLDSTGNVINNKGVFHTVWKRQNDGTWKFVWD